METFINLLLKIASIIMLVVFGLSVVLLIVNFRKPKKVSVPSLIIAAGMSLITLVIFSLLIKYQPPLWLWLLMAVIGITVGFFWAKTTKVFIYGHQVISQNSIWYLAVWGGIFAFNQMITIITNRPPDTAMALLIVSTGTVWGTSGDIIRRYFKVKGGLQLAMANAEQSTTIPTQPSGTALEAPSAKATPIKSSGATYPSKGGYCPKCGVLLRPGAAFCMKCGEKV